MEKGKLLFTKDNGTKVYELDYALYILENNPIRRNELKYAMGKAKMHHSSIPQKIQRNAWNLYFKKHKKIMVYSTYPEDTYWYVNKQGKKIRG